MDKKLKAYYKSLSFSRIKILEYLSYFIFIDLLLLPYFQLLIMPLSLPLVIASFFFLNLKVTNDKFLFLFLIITIMVILSLGISIVFPKGNEFAIDNFKYAIQFISTFSYFFYFKYVLRYINLNIRPVIILFIIWFIVCVCIYLYNPSYSIKFLSFIYGKLVKLEVDVFDDLRFAYIFQDPNTAMYFYLIAISIFFSFKKTTIYFWLLILISLIILVLGQSKGSLIALILMVLSLLLKNKVINIYKPVNLIMIGLISVFIAYIFIFYKSLADENIFIKYSYDRLFSNQDVYLEGGGRFEIWQKFFDYFFPLPLGRGYTLSINNQIYSPHSDALRLLYAYGFVVMISVVYFFFGKLKGMFHLIIPAFMAFSVNTLIDEQKLLALFLSILAIELNINSKINK